jgi:hypothetical protein
MTNIGALKGTLGLGRRRSTMENEFTPEETASTREKGRTIVREFIKSRKEGALPSKQSATQKQSLHNSQGKGKRCSQISSPASEATDQDFVPLQSNRKKIAVSASPADALLLQHRINNFFESGNNSYGNKSYVAAIADFKQVFTEVERSPADLDLARKNVARIADIHWKMGEMYENMQNLP